MNLSRPLSLLVSLLLVVPAFAYDYPLTQSAIRDAYFLGSRQGGISPDVLKQYSRAIPELHQGNCISETRIETPFLHIAQSLGSMPNYSAQDAVRDFYDHPAELRIFLSICYMTEAPPPNSVKLHFRQNKREILPSSDDRSVYSERFSDTSFLLPNGEKADVCFDPAKLDSSSLTILINTPNGQHAELSIDLAALR